MVIEDNTIFNSDQKKIIILSGGTSQMKMGLHLTFSAFGAKNVEFYNVTNGSLIPVAQKNTINKIFVKFTCLKLLAMHDYQTILELLKSTEQAGDKLLLELVEYGLARANFNFEAALSHLDRVKSLVPASLLGEFAGLEMDHFKDPRFLIKELLQAMDIVYNNQQYLLYLAYLFRIEEALLSIMVEYFYRDKLALNLNRKEDHSKLMGFLQRGEKLVWTWLQGLSYKGESISLDGNALNRPVLFYIAFKNEMENPTNVFRGLLEKFDIINKYLYTTLEEEERRYKYGDATSTKCLGDLRNQSILAHGFEPVSKEKIEQLYKNGEIPLSRLHSSLSNQIERTVDFLLDNRRSIRSNAFDQLNEKIRLQLLSL